eukprot:gene22281-27244_t
MESRPLVILEPPEPGFDWGERTDLNFQFDGPITRAKFREFLRNFRVANKYIYREALIRNWTRNIFSVDVDCAHLVEFDETLLHHLQVRPSEVLPFYEQGAKEALKQLLTAENQDALAQTSIPDFQILFKSEQTPVSLRSLTAEHVNTLIKVPGIVISASRARSKAVEITVKCSKCHDIQRVTSKNAMGGVAVPQKCMKGNINTGEQCGPNTLVIMADQCEYIDQQTLKLQESPEAVPTGEMPRHIMLSVDRYLVDRVSPGTRISVLGVVSLFSSMQTKTSSPFIRTPYLRVLGMSIDAEGGGRGSNTFTAQEEEEMQALSRDPRIYEKIAQSIAPSISGDYTVDIKKAIACLLMGGSRKVLPDGVRLRGDINILLMGDPSTAKSQFLKFVEQVSPIGVYTSGKGSSAAGLTASVSKDGKGEFYLEGGAMVLADGGVICIDEFDKMRETDRVAIHEAMEQQTISIAKAGITTMLNCRNSVLAAANPIYGRYDDLKDVGENIDLMTTILSRFDCIFIVRDVREAERDRDIARHVLGVHIHSSMAQDIHATPPPLSPATLKKYIMYCRARCAPRLSEEAANMLTGQYVHIRNQVRESLLSRPGEVQTVPITTRQLEAIVRLSESLAKMRLCAEATVSDVEEALRLFKVSTLAASQTSTSLYATLTGPQASQEVQRAEQFLLQRIGVRGTVSAKRVYEEAQLSGYSREGVRMCVRAMVMRGEMQEMQQGKILRRLK